MRRVPGVGGIPVGRARLAVSAVAAGVLAADLASKAAVRSLLTPLESAELIPGVLWITRVGNQGAAFGIMQGTQWLFNIVSIGVIIGVAWFTLTGRARSWWTVAALGLLAGGSAGNLYDRLTVGTVTDFVDLRWFPVFNVADSAIVVGTAIVVVLTLFFANDDDDEDLEDAEGSALREPGVEDTAADEGTGP